MRRLSGGERAVWAVAFDRELTAEIATASSSAVHPAIAAARHAAARVKWLREAARTARDVAPDGLRDLDDDDIAMLEDMLGERPPATRVPNAGVGLRR